MIGFGVSGWIRVVVGVAFTVGAGLMTWAIERPASTAGQNSSTTAPEQRSPGTPPWRELRLNIDSTYAVQNWEVTLAGVACQPHHTSTWSWVGTIAGPAESEVLIEAIAAPVSPAGDAGAAPLHGLRWTLGDTPAAVTWGSGDVVATVRVP
ncbi:MAG: hypothetical protein H0W78_12725 [Planctomycetes bacterium]|nr:hypothetical protein [Planctomycetota bacterium]